MYVHQGVLKPPLSAYVDPFLSIMRWQNIECCDIKNIKTAQTLLYKAFKYIKAFSKFPLKGYFEFIVNEQGLLFKNYQNQGGWINI